MNECFHFKWLILSLYYGFYLTENIQRLHLRRKLFNILRGELLLVLGIKKYPTNKL